MKVMEGDEECEVQKVSRHVKSPAACSELLTYPPYLLSYMDMHFILSRGPHIDGHHQAV